MFVSIIFVLKDRKNHAASVICILKNKKKYYRKLKNNKRSLIP